MLVDRLRRPCITASTTSSSPTWRKYTAYGNRLTSASRVAIDAGMGRGVREDGGDRLLNCCGEEASQSSTLFLIPDPGIEQLGLGFRSK
jgi:hypothetical protein